MRSLAIPRAIPRASVYEVRLHAPETAVRLLSRWLLGGVYDGVRVARRVEARATGLRGALSRSSSGRGGFSLIARSPSGLNKNYESYGAKRILMKQDD